MDFSTIKQIVIPEGIVKKIEDGDGNVLWQKVAEPEWHTLWSGSEYAEVYTYRDSWGVWRSSISNTNVLATIPIEAMADGCQLRLTGSYSGSSNIPSSDRYYAKNETTSRSKPKNPYVINTTSLGTDGDVELLGLVALGDSDGRYQGHAYLSGNSNTRELKLDTHYNSSQNIGYQNYNAHFTITKIEAYY